MPVCAGMASVKLGKRGVEHSRAAKLDGNSTKYRTFSRAYPDGAVKDQVPERKGTWQDLEHRVCIAMDRTNKRQLSVSSPGRSLSLITSRNSNCHKTRMVIFTQSSIYISAT